MLRHNILLPLFLIVSGLFPLYSFGTAYSVKEISHLEINSAITPATYDYLKYQFKNIPDGALILIKINTPGGLISTTKDLIMLIGSQKKPVVVWVTPEAASAASAGAIIASSAHFILMSPGTHLGAATPVGLGEDIKESDGRSKAMNDLKALVRSLSNSRNRPAGPFEEMIQSAKSFTNQEALKLKIIDGVVMNNDDLKSLLHLKEFQLNGEIKTLELPHDTLSKDYPPTFGQKLLNVLADPSTAYLLFLIGVALLYFEFQAPGGYVAGGVGILFLILAAVSFQVLPLDWGAFALLILGLVLLILELYITSYGLLALGGIVSFVVGSLFLFHGEAGFISVDYPVLMSILAGTGVAIGIIVGYMIKERKKQNGPSDFFMPVGSTGTILTIDGSHYQIKVKGEIWRGTSTESLSIGDSIQVVSINTEKLIAEIKKL